MFDELAFGEEQQVRCFPNAMVVILMGVKQQILLHLLQTGFAADLYLNEDSCRVRFKAKIWLCINSVRRTRNREISKLHSAGVDSKWFQQPAHRV